MNMRPTPHNSEPDETPSPEEALVEGLRRLRPSPPPVPADRDRQILTLCQAELATRLATKAAPERTTAAWSGKSLRSQPEQEARRIVAFPWQRLGWAAAAAAALILGLVWLPGSRSSRLDLAIDLQSPTVLDAFALARRLEAGTVSDPRLDLNQDGQVDGADATWLARRAVQLPPDEAP